MENYFVIIMMILLMAINKRLVFLPVMILISAVTANVAMLIHDIALYYAFISVASMTLAYIAVSTSLIAKTEISKCNLIYAMLMFIQSAICFALIPDIGATYNNFFQYVLIEYNEALWIIFILLGVIDCGYFNSSSSANGSNSDTRNNRTD